MLGVVVVPRAANALPSDHNNLCGRFPASTEPIYYRFSAVSDLYQTVTYDGRERWNQKATDVKFRGSGSTYNIFIEDDYYPNQFWAWVGPDAVNATCGGSTNGLWNNNQVRLRYNVATMSQIDNVDKYVVAAHELGHAAGMSHPTSGTCRTNASLMYQGTEKFTYCRTPSVRDVDHLNAMYY
ncbi:matrixin family metalloprotease [Phycicoccus sp. MAQZ13P-2]|uniref:matrixin family metalloprotease n=1 Tax=Phycicoccus mangrovi TaxID=2840470 RepID=UPI001BFFFD81|nr:matrixin family metalloprotease [Phycicoccus mangrovi]MBT9255834.1 matrixin family metalloprotease [Phycicoccus mangrovi]MBT9274428.1 matrixin family metalloprotease [Phycicoccus mangrovi]